jgi:hypothetical protein
MAIEEPLTSSVAELKGAPIVPVAAEPGRDPVEAGPESQAAAIVRVAVALELVLEVAVPVPGRVEGVLEPVLVVVAPVQDQARRPVPAEAAPIKLEIAAYLRVQVRAVAASAVAAETLLAPAAAAAALA